MKRIFNYLSLIVIITFLGCAQENKVNIIHETFPEAQTEIQKVMEEMAVIAWR